MRTEIKAAIAIGLVVFVAAVIWAVNSAKKAKTIPFDLPAPQVSPAEGFELASSETPRPAGRAAPRPAPAQQAPAPAYTPPARRPERPRTAGNPPGARPATPRQPRAPQTAPAPAPARPQAAPAQKAPAPQSVAARLEALHKPEPKGVRYTIQLGDTLIAIARAHYGADRYWTAIQAANPGVDPRRLRAGQVIRLPPREQVLRQGARARPQPPAPTGRKARQATYVVGEGDTLIAIARNVLKDESRYLEIFELNRDRLESADVLPVGIELRLPPVKPQAEHVTPPGD